MFRAPDYFQYTESVEFETTTQEGDAAVDAPLVQSRLCYKVDFVTGNGERFYCKDK